MSNFNFHKSLFKKKLIINNENKKQSIYKTLHYKNIFLRFKIIFDIGVALTNVEIETFLTSLYR